MNPEAQEIFDKILKKNPNELTIEEIKFLKARRSYLKQREAQEYADVLSMDISNIKVTTIEPQVVETTLKEVKPEEESYTDVYNRARALGFKGKRIPREDLEAFIASKQA